MELVETSFDYVPVWGTFESNRPLILTIRGAFADFDHFTDLDPLGCDLALLHLPGFYSPRFETTSIEAFITAFDEVIQERFSGRDVTVVGLSVGSLVALGLRSPQIRAVVAVEPFFSTAKLWPIERYVRRWHAIGSRPRQWAADIFGIAEVGVDDRDYGWVLGAADRPTLGLVGDIPLQPPRHINDFPSLTDDADRARIPHRIVPGGHNISPAEVRRALVELRPT